MSSPLRKKKEIVFEGLTPVRRATPRESPWKVGVAGSHWVCRPAWRVPKHKAIVSESLDEITRRILLQWPNIINGCAVLLFIMCSLVISTVTSPFIMVKTRVNIMVVCVKTIKV